MNWKLFTVIIKMDSFRKLYKLFLSGSKSKKQIGQNEKKNGLMDNLLLKIKSYLSDRDNTSILINGEWGSGKTYYVKNQVIPLIEKDFKLKPIYISLNGVSSNNEIVNQIILSKIGISKKIVAGAGLIKPLLDIIPVIPGLNNLKLPGGNNFTSFLDLNDSVLIFDDVERISEKYNIEDLLGFLNTEFIEHNHYRTIFVANEKEIHSDRYRVIKEKIIEHTYLFHTNINKILQEFAKGLTQEIALNFQKYQEYLLNLLNKYEIKNLRTVFYILKILTHILEKTPADIFDKNYHSIMTFVVSICNELKIGNLSTEDIENPKELTTIVETISMRRITQKSSRVDIGDKKNEEDYLDKFYRKYLENTHFKFKFYRSIYELILTGHVEDSLLKEDINPSSKLNEWDEAREVLIHYQYYSEETVLNSINKVIEFAKQGIYNPLSYGYLFYWIEVFCERKIIRGSKKILTKDFKDGLKKAIEIHGLESNFVDRQYYLSDRKANAIDNLVKKLLYEKDKQDNEFTNDEFIRNLGKRENISSYFKRYETKPFFQLLKLKMFSERIKELDTNETFLLSAYISDRYNFGNINEYFKVEKDALSKLSLLLAKNNISATKNPLKKDAIKRLSELLEKISKRLN